MGSWFSGGPLFLPPPYRAWCGAVCTSAYIARPFMLLASAVGHSAYTVIAAFVFSQWAFDIGFALRLLLPSVDFRADAVNQESLCASHRTPHPQTASLPPCPQRPTAASCPR